MAASHWGSFALVSYIPDPLGSFFNGMRRSLPGCGFAQAHITVLPPRRLATMAERASEQALDTLRKFPSFDVSFCSLRRFESTNMLYLPLSDGNAVVSEMHHELNTGDLAGDEQFEFVPHLTVGGPVPADQIESAESKAAAIWEACQYPNHFRMTEIVALHAAHKDGPGYCDWTCLWQYSLASNYVRNMIATP